MTSMTITEKEFDFLLNPVQAARMALLSAGDPELSTLGPVGSRGAIAPSCRDGRRCDDHGSGGVRPGPTGVGQGNALGIDRRDGAAGLARSLSGVTALLGPR